jgi:hypothetical protein|tara:strand:- start:158 stop:544 length:387 start_codon:yes stop_codon:yes gene_type:complete
MNAKQKEIAENIIAEMKIKNGSISEHSVNRFRDGLDIHIILDSLIDDYKLLNRDGRTNFRLTKEGYEFPSFSDLERQEQQEIKHRQVEFDLAKSNIEANRLNKRNSNWNVAFSIINILIGVLNAILLI